MPLAIGFEDKEKVDSAKRKNQLNCIFLNSQIFNNAGNKKTMNRTYVDARSL